jgi:hypothetical protein
MPTRWVLASIIPIAVWALPICLVATSEHCTWSPIPTTPHSTVNIKGDALVIIGGIDHGLVHKVRAALQNSGHTVKRIEIKSYGGANDAMEELVLAVALLGPIPIDVPEACYSACIGFLAKTQGPKHIAPSAALMFHSSTTTATPYTSDPHCRCWVLVASFVNMFRISNPRNMLPWATMLSTHLPVLFDLCPIHPLDTSRGMILSGREFNDLRGGLIHAEQLTFRCPSDRS